MATGLLGSLRVRLQADTADFRAGMEQARKRLGTFDKGLGKVRLSTLASVASLGALTAAFRSSIEVANEYDKAQAQLAATAKLTGVQFEFLQSVSKQAQSQFKLSAIAANGFTIELTKLAGKAGDMGKASVGLEAFLDLGAARGLTASETLKAVQQSILGIDEGTDKLFSKNPSVLYAEFAASIGTTAGKLTDAQKAQSILTAAIADGGKVRGEYLKWLGSAQGQQYLLSQSIEQSKAVIGKALQPALVALIPLFRHVAEAVVDVVQGFHAFNAIVLLAGRSLGAFWAMVTQGASAGRAAMDAALDDFKQRIEEIRKIGQEAAPDFVPSLLPTGPTQQAQAEAEGRKTAFRFFDGLRDEWEQLRYSVALRELSLTGTESQRLALEEAHALRMLAIEEDRLKAQHKGGDLSAEDLEIGLKELAARRNIARERRKEFEAVDKALAKQRNMLGLIDSVTGLLPTGSGPGANIGQSAGKVAADKLPDIASLAGGLVGSVVLPGVGSLIGSAIGSLFKRDEKEQQRQTAALQRIDQNTRQTATLLELSRQLADAARGAVNVPSRFALPQYAPAGGGILVQVTQTNHIAAPDSHGVVAAMRRDLGVMLKEEFRSLGIGR